MFKFDALTEVTQYLELLVLVSLQWIERIRMLRPTHWGSWIFYQDFRGNHQFKLSLKTVEPFSIKQRNFYDQTWIQNHLWTSQYQHFCLCIYWIPWVMLIKKLWWWYLHEAVSLPKFQARGKQLHRSMWPSHRPWPSAHGQCQAGSRLGLWLVSSQLSRVSHWSLPWPGLSKDNLNLRAPQ